MLYTSIPVIRSPHTHTHTRTHTQILRFCSLGYSNTSSKLWPWCIRLLLSFRQSKAWCQIALLPKTSPGNCDGENWQPGTMLWTSSLSCSWFSLEPGPLKIGISFPGHSFVTMLRTLLLLIKCIEHRHNIQITHKRVHVYAQHSFSHRIWYKCLTS